LDASAADHRGRKYDTPTSHAVRPMRMNAAFIRAAGAARRMSEASARAKPPPLAGPLTNATIGCGARRMRIMISLTRRCTRNPATGPASPSARSSFRSSPAQKPRPAPVRITTRTE
jgi:hypothetical protein